MKTIAIATLALFLVFQFSDANAATDKLKECKSVTSVTETYGNAFQANIFPNASDQVVVIVNNKNSYLLDFEISDNKGNVMYESVLRGDPIRQKFSTKNLESGAYQFTIRTDGECITKTIEVK